MAGSLEEWARYERWSGALADIVYSPALAGQPAYLDLEEDVLSAIRDRAEPGAASPTTALVEVVLGTLVFRGGPATVLRGHLRRLDTWDRGDHIAPPPTLVLLGLLSLAAEHMQHDADMRAHNFYGRLAELAALDADEIRWFQTAYRARRKGVAVSADLWGSLNHWLEVLEGVRGLPTAFPIGHDHIGYPLSQALVRHADREKFPDLFVTQALPPKCVIPPDEMAAAIDEWMARVPCPASNTLEGLWKRHQATRAPIVEVARLELAHWDGVSPTGSSKPSGERQIDSIRLRASLHSFLSRRIDLSMVVPGVGSSDIETFEILDHDDNVAGTVDLTPCASGWLGTTIDCVIDASSFLDAEVRLRDPREGRIERRRPHRLVALRWDELLHSYVESERVHLGEESMLLSKTELAPRIAAALEPIARPGFWQSSDLAGLPPGWTLFGGAQVFAPVQDPLPDLNVLQPRVRSQTVLEGGLRLPGYLRKWLTARPPELRALWEGASRVGASIACVRPLADPAPDRSSRHASGPVLLWDLSDLGLCDGDYELHLVADGKLVGSELLRLRSADNPALQVDDREPIKHDRARPEFGLLPGRSSGPTTFEVAPETEADLTTELPPAVPGWRSARAAGSNFAPEPRRVTFPAGAPPCMETGAHYMVIPTELHKRTVDGVCRFCGLVKRYPTTPGGARKRSKVAPKPAAPVHPAALPELRPEESVDWSVAFDALCHVGGGSITALERITGQMEAGAVFGDAFERRLEVLGHIEIQRSPSTLAPASWRVNETTIVGLLTGDLAVAGFRSEKVLSSLAEQATVLGGRVAWERNVTGPPVIRITGLDDDGARRLAKGIISPTKRIARYLPAAAQHLAAGLPPLSQALAGLPRTVTVSARSYERWDPLTAQFKPSSDAVLPGAYRLNGILRTYVYRREQDVGAMRAVLGDARIVKYLAALDRGSSLIGYDADAQVLYVPLGADLPGLYGRAAVLASGFPPEESPRDRVVRYRRIPPQLAAHLNRLLMS